MRNGKHQEAIYLANLHKAKMWPGDISLVEWAKRSADGLRRQHARIVELEAQRDELLEALKTLTGTAESFADELHAGHPDVATARAAIAKVKGETP